MKDETIIWLNYADENYESALVLLNSHLYNPVLQNIQQAIEKYLKAFFIDKGIKLQKTHNILSLIEILNQNNIYININEDEIDLIDSIYLSSRYPFGSVLADFEADESICKTCIDVMSKIKIDVKNHLKLDTND